MPWLGFRRSRSGAPQPWPSVAEDPAVEAERFFRRQVGDATWERSPNRRRTTNAPTAGSRLGPALHPRPTTLRRGHAQRAGGVRPRRPIEPGHHHRTMDYLAAEIPGAIGFAIHDAGTEHTSRARTHSPSSCAPRWRKVHGPARARVATNPRVRRGEQVNILVSGSHGMIGQALGTRLRAEGHQVIASCVPAARVIPPARRTLPGTRHRPASIWRHSKRRGHRRGGAPRRRGHRRQALDPAAP